MDKRYDIGVMRLFFLGRVYIMYKQISEKINDEVEVFMYDQTVFKGYPILC